MDALRTEKLPDYIDRRNRHYQAALDLVMHLDSVMASRNLLGRDDYARVYCAFRELLKASGIPPLPPWWD